MSTTCYLMLITSICFHLTLCLDTCTGFTCKWTVDKYELDLRPFQLMGLNLTGFDNTGNEYYFSPCNNLIPFASTYGRFQYMAVQTHTWGQKRNYLAQYDGKIEPGIRFDSNQQPIWTFKYNLNFSVEYFCQYNLSTASFMEITQVLEVFPGSFILQITSHYVCDNVTVSDELNINQCIWYDQTGENVLDLRPLYGQRILGTTNSYNQYVCQNSKYETGGICGTGSSGCCGTYSGVSVYGFWDPSVQPLYDPNNDYWTFAFQSYPNRAGGVPDKLIIRWQCAPPIKTYEVLLASSNTMYIASTHACPDRNRCIFIDGENVLNLTDLYGDMIRYVNEDVTYSFEYTVCRNSIICNGNIETMAMRWNTYEQQCDPYLAIWDGFDSYDLSYNQDEKQWKITYDNGEICENEINTAFNIYWTCNQTIPKWEVMSVEIINECEYTMFIGSSFAC